MHMGTDRRTNRKKNDMGNILVMSKKHKQMDKHFQIWNIKRFLKCNSIEADTIDSISLIDSKLYYPENESNIRQILSISDNNRGKYECIY